MQDYFYYYPLSVVLFLLITCRPSTPCSTLATRTVACARNNFPQLSATVLGAQVVDTSLVWRYLTVPASGHRWARSYSRFLGWSHLNFDFIPFPPIVTAVWLSTSASTRIVCWLWFVRHKRCSYIYNILPQTYTEVEDWRLHAQLVCAKEV